LYINNHPSPAIAAQRQKSIREFTFPIVVDTIARLFVFVNTHRNIPHTMSSFVLHATTSHGKRMMMPLAMKGFRSFAPSVLVKRHWLSTTFPITPDVCDDCIDTIQVIDPALGFRSFGGKSHFGGQAVTVKCHEDNSMVKHLAKNVDGTGKIIVVDGGGSKRRALLGDMVAADCLAQGWEGLVIYGCIRDVDEVATMIGLGVQALGSHPIPTTKRNEGQIDVPVTFGGVTIAPGDWVVCDNNGIVVNPTDPREERAKKES
jgi:regulator of ribonuclease activity A